MKPEMDLFGDIIKPRADSVLREKFIMPPFSVLSARDGEWQERKRKWLALGIRSEVGRGGSEADASFKSQGAQRALQSGGGRHEPRPDERDDSTPETISRSGSKASPGGSLMPACDYSRRQRGNGKGQPLG